jgi:hypothetical protein
MVSVPKLVITFPYFTHIFTLICVSNGTERFKNGNNYLNLYTNIYSYLVTSGVQGLIYI